MSASLAAVLVDDAVDQHGRSLSRSGGVPEVRRRRGCCHADNPPWSAPPNYSIRSASPRRCTPAATVLLLRDTPEGIEVLMTRRSRPRQLRARRLCVPRRRASTPATPPRTPSPTRRPTQDDVQLTQAIAAIRESFEELGVLLARHADGRPRDDADDVAAMDRSPTPARASPTSAPRAGCGWRPTRVFTLAHWITDRDLPQALRRALPGGAHARGPEPTADETEQFEPCWVRPADALAAPCARAASS